MSLLRAMATVGGLTMVSRIAGFARDLLTAALLGAGPVADAFFVALRLPNLFRKLFAEGALAVSFVPIFSESLQREGRPPAIAFAEDTLALMMTVLVPMTMLALAFMPAIVWVIAPGFIDEPDRFSMTVEFARITFPYLLMISLVALMGSVLNSLNRFAPFAAAPILFNLTLIAALLGLTPLVTTAGHALSYGVAAAGVAQLLLLAAACKMAGVRMRLVAPRLSPRIIRLFKLMAPAALGAGVMQLNLFVSQLLATFLPVGAVSYLYFADRFYQLPLGVIGIALGTAMLPLLSRQIAAGAGPEALATQNRATELGLFFSLPATVALLAVPGTIISVLLERGAWEPADTVGTAQALAAYAVGIPAYILVKVLATMFFARQDVKTPVRFAIVGAAANIAFGVILVFPFAHVGLALATSLAAWINAGLLGLALVRRNLVDLDRTLLTRTLRMLGASVIMGVAVYFAADALTGLLSGGTIERILALFLLVVGGAVLYLVVAAAVGAVDRRELRRVIRR